MVRALQAALLTKKSFVCPRSFDRAGALCRPTSREPRTADTSTDGTRRARSGRSGRTLEASSRLTSYFVTSTVIYTQARSSRALLSLSKWETTCKCQPDTKVECASSELFVFSPGPSPQPPKAGNAASGHDVGAPDMNEGPSTQCTCGSGRRRREMTTAKREKKKNHPTPRRLWRAGVAPASSGRESTHARSDWTGPRDTCQLLSERGRSQQT